MIITRRADELITGDRFNTHCGIGMDAYATILKVRIEENDHPGSEDRVEVTFDTDAISNTRGFQASSKVQVWVEDAGQETFPCPVCPNKYLSQEGADDCEEWDRANGLDGEDSLGW